MQSVAFVGLIVVFFGSIFVPGILMAPAAARFATCNRRLGAIGLALNCYHNVHGAFPPAYVAAEDGRPMHSWRVLILPYLDRKDLYERYDFGEPWDGPNNRFLAAEMPEAYRCPFAPHQKTAVTSYVAVVGEECAWHGGQSVSHDEFANGMSNAILLVEVAESGIHWMEPRDMTYSQAILGIDTGAKVGISSHHRKWGPHCLIPPIQVLELSKDLPRKTLKELLTVGDKKEGD